MKSYFYLYTEYVKIGIHIFTDCVYYSPLSFDLSSAKCEKEGKLCSPWAKAGECGKNWKFMEQKCWKSCSNCGELHYLAFWFKWNELMYNFI